MSKDEYWRPGLAQCSLRKGQRLWDEKRQDGPVGLTWWLRTGPRCVKVTLHSAGSLRNGLQGSGMMGPSFWKRIFWHRGRWRRD